MKTELKLALVITLILWFGGCTTNIQVGGRKNTIHREHKEKDRTVRLWGRDMKANCLQDVLERGK